MLLLLFSTWWELCCCVNIISRPLFLISIATGLVTVLKFWGRTLQDFFLVLILISGLILDQAEFSCPLKSFFSRIQCQNKVFQHFNRERKKHDYWWALTDWPFNSIWYKSAYEENDSFLRVGFVCLFGAAHVFQQQAVLWKKDFRQCVLRRNASSATLPAGYDFCKYLY